jgi:hypothetical protein
MFLSTTLQRPGSTMGSALYVFPIFHQIVQAHGDRIEVRTREVEYSEFSVTLPVRRAG